MGLASPRIGQALEANGCAGGEPTVPMLDNLFSPQLNNLQRAMSRASERQSLLMANLANVNVPGYKRRDVDLHIAADDDANSFESHFAQLRAQQAQNASDQTSIRPDGNNVDMEKEVVSIADTEMYYSAVSDLATNYFSNLKSVIREGR